MNINEYKLRKLSRTYNLNLTLMTRLSSEFWTKYSHILMINKFID